MPDSVTAPAKANASGAGPVIDAAECKGCGRCVVACPKQVLSMTTRFNARGVHYAEYKGEGCVGCCACFYSCPEPWAIEVRIPPRPPAKPPPATKGQP